MNLSKLFEMQKELDARILAEHPVQEGEDRIAKKILALQVELGELANCWRGFKFWSNDQEPRTKIEYICPTCNGTGDENYDSYIDDLEGRYPHEFIICEDCGGTGTLGYKNPLLEEYVDCLHFILSIGLDITDPELIELRKIDKAETITEQFIMIFDAVGELYKIGFMNIFEYEHWAYESLLIKFVDLGEMLGFTWEEIEEAYIRDYKHVVGKFLGKKT